MDIFKIKNFRYPYHQLKFPGQHSEERILFVTREGQQMLFIRFTVLIVSAFILRFLAGAINSSLISRLAPSLSGRFMTIADLMILLFLLISLWWIYTLWRKSVFIVTTRRLTKFIHTTPWNRYQLSLGLDKIVDTGSYQKGIIQALFKLGYLDARSSAGNIKHFYIMNVDFAEDLQNYINKLLFTFTEQKDRLDHFRPFIPYLKGEARDEFVRRHTPEFAKPK